ncbi:proline dehydrogenase family protein [Paenibacillus sp. LHD-117]|uniref:proline dehydrogenase family protein n=1 Tax=Paenibacillus sp. LHD-117 TaxID=3071412 RepID=UPI0027DEDD8E|nr:proline dehydrogenase family protein [Paenibacillus sp. LHD-117]MDQ6422798.1 proline dehydrogenase family protein [Paenibacillus sp. LHD-117]
MAIGTELYRKTLLTIAGNRAVRALTVKYGKRLASRFIAGQQLPKALFQVKELNKKGIMATLDHLGEGIRQLPEAEAYRDAYIRLLDGIADKGVASNVSLKPTQMGLALDREACYRNIRAVARHAASIGNFVRLDMEDSPYTDATLDIVRRLHAEGLRNVGTVLQAYLRRTASDTERCIDDGISLRLVKGAYKEPSSIAYQRKDEVAQQFKHMIRLHLDQGVYTAVATHDDAIIRYVKRYALERRIPKSAFEFQMLYGLRMNEQANLAREGYRIRCYVPYGEMWYPYYTRRLAEKPANLWLVLRNMFR